jgi:hypothetical protein
MSRQRWRIRTGGRKRGAEGEEKRGTEEEKCRYSMKGMKGN